MIYRLAAETVGTALLLYCVTGSAVLGAMLADGRPAVAVTLIAFVTGGVLYVLTTTLGPVSGAHFNPAVSIAFAMRGQLPFDEVTGYVVAQLSGGILGVWAAHMTFGLPMLQISQSLHNGTGIHWQSEGMATFGLVLIIVGGIKTRASAVPALVALYVAGLVLFTSQTSFANLAITFARGFSDTFIGMPPGHIPAVLFSQLFAVGCAYLVLLLLFGKD